MNPEEIRAIALQVARELLDEPLNIGQAEHYTDFATRFLAAITAKAEPLPDEVREIVERLRIRTGSWMVAEQLCIEAAEMIERLARQVPPDCVVVPREPTEAMLAELFRGYTTRELAYKSMIAAGEVKP